MKVTKENITPYELDILKRDQYDRKIREIEIRARNIKRREHREMLWGRKPVGNKEVGTVDELLRKNRSFSKLLNKRKNKKNQILKSKNRNKKVTSINEIKENTHFNKTLKAAKNKDISSQIDFTNTQKIGMFKNNDSKQVLTLFYSQAKVLIQEMKSRMQSSQSILKIYMDKLEKIIKGEKHDKYLDDSSEQGRGFIEKIIMKEQREKYGRLACMTRIEDRIGLFALFDQLSEGAEELNLTLLNEALANVDDLNEEGRK